MGIFRKSNEELEAELARKEAEQAAREERERQEHAEKSRREELKKALDGKKDYLSEESWVHRNEGRW